MEMETVTDSGSQPANAEVNWPVLYTERAPVCCADPAAVDQTDVRVKSRIVFRASWLDVGVRLACDVLHRAALLLLYCNRGAVCSTECCVWPKRLLLQIFRL